MRACRAPVVCVHARVGVGASGCTLRPAAKVDSAGGLRESTSHTMRESTPHPTPQSTTQSHRAKEARRQGTREGMGDMRRGKETRHCWEWVICSNSLPYPGLPIYLHTYINISAYIHIYVYNVYIYMYIYIYMYMYMYIYIYICVCVYTCIYSKRKGGKEQGRRNRQIQQAMRTQHVLVSGGVLQRVIVCCSVLQGIRIEGTARKVVQLLPRAQRP